MGVFLKDKLKIHLKYQKMSETYVDLVLTHLENNQNSSTRSKINNFLIQNDINNLSILSTVLNWLVESTVITRTLPDWFLIENPNILEEINNKNEEELISDSCYKLFIYSINYEEDEKPVQKPILERARTRSQTKRVLRNRILH